MMLIIVLTMPMPNAHARVFILKCRENCRETPEDAGKIPINGLEVAKNWVKCRICRNLSVTPYWEGVESPRRELKDLCVYEMHVRGLTAGGEGAGTGTGRAAAGMEVGEETGAEARAEEEEAGAGAGAEEGEAERGTYAALISKLPYLKRMGQGYSEQRYLNPTNPMTPKP